MHRRRFLLTSLTVAAAAPRMVRAQPADTTVKVGFLAKEGSTRMHAFSARLSERGWIEGQNLTIVFRLWGASPERARDMANELVAAGVDVIIAVAPTAIEAAQEATSSIPIVALFSLDLGGSAPAHGTHGNVTGLLWDTGVDDYSTRMLEVFTVAVPRAHAFAALWNLDSAIHRPYVKAAEAALSRLGRRLVSAGIRDAPDLDALFRRIRAEGAEAAIVYADALTFALRDSISTLALAHRLPTLVTSHQVGFKDTLLVFGPHTGDWPAHAADFVDRLLRGAKPSDLPLEPPAKYNLTINLRVAQALRVTIPLSLLLRADKVIE